MNALGGRAGYELKEEVNILENMLPLFVCEQDEKIKTTFLCIKW